MNSVSDYSVLCDDLRFKYRSSPKQMIVVLIGGLSRSGKSTLSKKIGTYLKYNKIENRYISLDNWIVDISKRKDNETVRERFLYDDIVHSIRDILAGKDIAIYAYDPISRSKSESLIYINGLEYGVLVIDGVVSLDIKELRGLSQFKVYVSTDSEARLKRLIDFHAVEKNLDMKEISSIIKKREIDETPIIEESRKFADYQFVN